MRFVLAAAVVVMFVALPSAAQQYQLDVEKLQKCSTQCVSVHETCVASWKFTDDGEPPWCKKACSLVYDDCIKTCMPFKS